MNGRIIESSVQISRSVVDGGRAARADIVAFISRRPWRSRSLPVASEQTPCQTSYRSEKVPGSYVDAIEVRSPKSGVQ